MDFHDLVKSRYSVRKYSGQPVPDDVLRRILDDARLAPSACNCQPWHFFVVRDAETRQRLFPQAHYSWVVEAPVLVVACSRPAKAWIRRYDRKSHVDVDLGIAMEHIVLSATEEGLGTCWICSFDPTLFRQVLDLPAEMEPVAATPMGIADMPPGPRDREPLHALVTWR